MAEPTLRKGSRDPAVRDLQDAIKSLVREPSGEHDGVFGEGTESDVRKFQSAQGLDADGVVGKMTWRAIDNADLSTPTLKKGSHGNPVRRLQLRLSLFGFDTKGVDGKFGGSTEGAVKHCQRDFGLEIDGIVGTKTWSIVDSLEVEPQPN
jgi:peptidoglycan hydrolase-like protein with peptidoglycan-binding domain